MIIGAANQNIFDSESARYGSIYLIPNSLACVEVNEKNRFGDYAGFQNIVAKYISGRWFYVDSVRDVSISCLDLIAELHEKAN